MADDFTIGVEEEFFLVDVESRRLRPVAAEVLPETRPVDDGEVGPELQQCQVETGTGICHTLGEVTEEVGCLRRTTSAAAREVGCAIASSGSHALGFDDESSRVTPEPAYLRLERDYRLVSRQAIDGEPWADPRPELRRAAMWRAARFGLDGPLVDLEGCRSLPAADMVDRLLAFVRPALADLGDWDRVRALVAQVVDGGTGAVRQRRAFERRHRVEDVVDLVLAETVRPAPPANPR